jgi:cephalosporin hydroxylase
MYIQHKTDGGKCVKQVLDWTIREWFEYHQKCVHQGSISGYDHLQQRWLGRVIWKNPMDCWVYQEILYDTQPDVLIELGVAHGGNLLYLSHLFRLMDKPNAMLIGVDIDTSKAADLRIPGLQLVQGNCLDPHTLQRVSALCGGKRTMVIADCDHNKSHVLQELAVYSPQVSVGCYYIVEDGICDVMGWNPATGEPVKDVAVPGPQAAAKEFLSSNRQFVDDAPLREKYLMTYNFNGFLRRVQ